MIITEQKPLAEILEGLKGCARVFLVGCGECATLCNTGGEKQLLEMEQLLRQQGKTVSGFCVPKAPCVAGELKKELAKNMRQLRQAEALLVLSCGLGTQSVQENDRLGLKVLPGCNTLFGAVVDGKGNFFEKCSLCGECVLAKTAGICPLTLCPKGLLNGPCGGMDKGKCEADKERDCAWVLIYRQMEKQGCLGNYGRVSPAKDYQKLTRPHQLLVEK